MTAEFERLAYEAALRALDKQERLLEELRSRAGVLLAAASLAASVLGQQAFRHPSPSALASASLAAFAVSFTMSIYVLLPRRDLVVAERGAAIYEALHDMRDDMAEVYRRLAYQLSMFWKLNAVTIERLARAYTIAAGALVAETLLLVALLSDTLV